MEIISITENSVITDCGIARFYAVKKIKARTHCNFCWLKITNCRKVHCGMDNRRKRKDGKVGIFGIRETPLLTTNN